MREPDIEQIIEALIPPVKAILERVLTVLEDMSARLEVLELEQLHRRGYDEDP